MASITLDAIRKSFGDTHVLKGVSLDIADGEFVTLVGPSGCGKSTLLRILAGLEEADSGSIKIGTSEVSNVRPSDRDLAMVFQSYALYPHLTVEQNMMTPLRMRDLSTQQRLPVIGSLLARKEMKRLKALVSETAQTLQIEHLLGRKPGQLSGGQRQRVALGRAMVREPKAFLMDEPLSNLDAALRVHMRSELSQLHKRLGTTFVYVTHDQAEALTMSSRMAVMMGGHVLQYGPPNEVYNNPNSLAVAQFIGSPKINTVAGETDASGRLSINGQDCGLVLQAQSTAVTVGIRPEHLRLVSGQGRLSGTVQYTENLGSDVFLHVALPDQSRVLARCTPAEAAQVVEGQTVNLTADAADMLVFDAEGQRVATKSQVAVPA